MLGPMPVEEFLRQFLSADTISFEDMPSPKGAFSGVLNPSDKITKETGIYAPLVGVSLSLRFRPNIHCHTARSKHSPPIQLVATSEALAAPVSPFATRRTTQTSRAA